MILIPPGDHCRRFAVQVQALIRRRSNVQRAAPRQGRAFGKVARDAGGQRVDEPVLVGRVAQAVFLVGLEMKAVSTRMLGCPAP